MNKQLKKHTIIIFSILLILSTALCSGLCFFSIENNNKKNLNFSQANCQMLATWNNVRVNSAKNILANLQTDVDISRYALTKDSWYTLTINDKIKTYAHIYGNLYFDVGIYNITEKKYFAKTEVVNFSESDFPETEGSFKYRHGQVFYEKKSYINDLELVFLYILYDDMSSVFFDENSTQAHYYVLNNNELIFSNDSKPVINNLKELTESNSAIDGYSVSCVVSENFKYVYCIKNTFPYSAVVPLFLIYILLIVASYVLSKKIVASFSTPVREFIDELKQIESISDIETLEDGLQNIKNMQTNITEIKKEAQIRQKLLIQSYLSDLYHGILVDYHANNIIKEYNIDIINKNHRLILASIVNDTECAAVYTVAGVPFIKTDIIEILAGKFPSMLYFDDYYNGFCIITEDSDINFYEILENLSNTLQIEFNIDFKVCISDKVKGLKESTAEFNKLQLIKNSVFFIDDTKNIYESSKTKLNLETDVYYPIESERQIIQSIVNGETTLAENQIKHIIEANLAHANKFNLIMLKNSLIVTITRILKSIDNTLNDLYPGSVSLDFSLENLSSEEIKNKLFDMFVPILSYTGSVKYVENEKDIIEKFISDNLCRDISLYELAEHLGYSHYKTSRIFKTLFGENFKTYLNKKKVEYSKELLLKGHKISDVSTNIGCNCVETYIRIFKKYEGILPSSFIKDNLEQ